MERKTVDHKITFDSLHGLPVSDFPDLNDAGVYDFDFGLMPSGKHIAGYKKWVTKRTSTQVLKCLGCQTQGPHTIEKFRESLKRTCQNCNHIVDDVKRSIDFMYSIEGHLESIGYFEHEQFLKDNKYISDT